MVDQFDGFEDPKENWCKLPNALIEALPLIETVSEFKVITYILRHTWGYREDEKRITLDEFANGRKRKDGTRIDSGTGLTIPSIRDGLKRAIEHGFIEHHQDASDKARVKNFYSLKMRAGEKLLQSEYKEDSPGGKESLPRTEKETLETNPQKETKEGAAEKTPPEAPSRDFLTDVFNGHVNGLDPGVADPAQDIEHYMEYASRFVKVYHRLASFRPPRSQKPKIERLAEQEGADLAFWEKVVDAWIGAGWNPRNIDGMIECYERREIPSTSRKSGGNHAKLGRPATGRDPDETFFDPASGQLVRRDSDNPKKLIPVS